MKLPRHRKLVLSAALVLVVAGPLLALPRLRAALRWSTGFARHAREARLFYEPGAEAQANQIADALGSAVARVESAHGLPFAAPFRVYLCASHASFARRMGIRSDSPVRGFALARDVWLSPLVFEFHGLDTHAESLTHELSHLHFGQHLSWLHRARSLPTWFSEGMADRVAGTGFEIFSRRDGLAALVSGRRFEPDLAGRLPVRRRPTDYGVPAPLLLSQSGLFVEYLESTDATALERLVGAVLAGEAFEGAFRDSYHRPVAELWNQFLDDVGPVAPSTIAP